MKDFVFSAIVGDRRGKARDKCFSDDNNAISLPLLCSSSSPPIPKPSIFLMAPLASASSLDLHIRASATSKIFGSELKLGQFEKTQLRMSTSLKRNPGLELKASREPSGMTKELDNDKVEAFVESENGHDLFDDMKERFLNFKKHNYLKKAEHYANLAKGQAPKFLVIACADSRVCPSNILGFQPGEAFMVRNVANLVPPFERGPSETNAAMEFAVNTLEVENILIVGHSCCGGIRALMSMKDEEDPSGLIKSWVVVGKKASLRAKAAASNHSFDSQCTHCEKESINNSLMNLLTYPWIEERVRKGVISLHGGYYDFVNCTFEKWTMDHNQGSNLKEETGFPVKDRSFWC